MMAEPSTSAFNRHETSNCNRCCLYHTSLLSYPPKMYTPAYEYYSYYSRHNKDADHERLFAHCDAIRTLHFLLKSRVDAVDVTEGEKGKGDGMEGGTGEMWRKVVRELRAKAEGWRKEMQGIEDDIWDTYAEQGEDG
ncbi:MAG: hypothetical protein Q9184_000750 [Pyrenodesmia sp. 2 TL-2023]